jgi:nitrogen fixation/metabolism regulation signal transduction histidine kinase
MKYIIFVSVVLGLALLYLLSSASANTALFSQNYSSLLLMTIGLALSLTGLVGYQIWQLIGKLRRGIFGAKLTLRLATFFCVIAILPGILVYTISVEFLGKSIESWFDIRVENALEGGLNLGRNSLENELKQLYKKSQFLAMIVAEQTPEKYRSTLLRLTDKSEGQEVAIFDEQGRALVVVNGDKLAIWKTLGADMLIATKQQGSYQLIDVLPDNQLILRVLVKVASEDSPYNGRLLHLAQPVAKAFAADAEMVQTVYSDYQQLSSSRLGLKRLYGITLTLSLLIVLLSAVSAAIFFSERLSAPLAALAEGTRAVARGDYSTTYPVQSSDELGALTGLFNQMIVQLSDAKLLGAQQQQQVEGAKSFLENILKHLSSGVVVMNEQFSLITMNASAEHILDIQLAEKVGLSLAEIATAQSLFRGIATTVTQAFVEAEMGVWQKQVERMSKNGNQILLLKGMTILSSGEVSRVMVVDDVTYLLQAERQAAWGEVAKRLAHEIKNPLTPIQLCAERLQHKLSAKLTEQDAGLLQRATQTIISQVTAMKNMVTDFADYARSPTPKLGALDMHQLLNEVMGLYEDNSSPIKLSLSAPHTEINGDATRLRQVIHNLLHNAHDALLQIENPQILVSTANPSEGGLVLAVQDNGSGVPAALLGRIFEPYMTTKSKGTGLGLPIVKKIVEEHGATINIANVDSGGTRVEIRFPLAIEKEVT